MNLLFGIASALLLVSLYPGFSFTFLAPIALAPLLISLARQRTWKARFLIGELTGIVYWFGLCYWIQFVLAKHGGMGEFGGWATFLLFCILKALHMAVFSTLAGPLIRSPWATLAVPALWTGIERTHGPLGFAWLTLGNAAIDMGIPMRVAPFLGTYGVSFVLAMMSTAVALLVLRRPRIQLAPLALLLLLFAFPNLPGYTPGREIAIAVQPNVPQDAPRWTPDMGRELINRMSVMSFESATAEKNARLLLWPESPAPFYFEHDVFFHNQALRLARDTGLYFLFGDVTFGPSERPSNSSRLLNPKGELVARYDKMFLVPFGEFVPWPFTFVNRITQEAGDFIPGQKLVVMPVGSHGLGPFICYESAFPHLVRQFANEGADVLVNLTNDGYFGRTAARLQHLQLARMRAAENRRWVLRPTNDGYTVSIDPAGRIVDRLPPFESVAGRLHFNWVNQKTAYTQYGDWFAWSCLALSVVAAAAFSVVPKYTAG
ncbi:MAG: apolipoprotein N-acyltransferase [Bryobacterales bacterium]|nr:apolipoprotein N-acyltransferase [Bryobacterales bacterium]